MNTAIVVGSGPNGLAAAVRLAQTGLRVTVLEAANTIGGGTRTSEAIVDGLLHDHCSAVHPMAVGSPFLADLELHRYGLRWRLPEIDCAHPLDDGTAGVLYRSIVDTADGLGVDGPHWIRLFGRAVEDFDLLTGHILGPLLRMPRYPLRLARFGVRAALPAALLARYLRTERAKALFGGIAAHAMRPLEFPLSASIGLGILAAGHRHGWAIAEGGSRRITGALAALLIDLGGIVETGVPVTSIADLPPADVTLYDLSPAALADLLGDRLPSRVAAGYRRFRHGPGAFKVDFAVAGGVPWTAPAARRAGTVHLGGGFTEIADTEWQIHRGRLPARPFVLVGQQYLADPSRSVGDVHPIWSYAHVPHGYPGDATEAIIAQIERFAPGFRDRVVGIASRSTAQSSEYNPNYVGGDILTGANSVSRLVFGPRHTLHPYDTGVPGHLLCSAATPPGPGAHGLCGMHAADRALAYLRRIRRATWR